MTAVIVIGAIVFLLLLLLFWPMVLRFSYHNEEMHASVRYVFFRFRFFPKNAVKDAEKEAKKAAKREYKKQKKQEKSKLKQPKAASDTLKTIWAILKASKNGLNRLRKHLTVYNIKINMLVGGADAHEAGLAYGKMCALVANGISVLGAIFRVKEPQVRIEPSFAAEKNVYDCSFRARIQLWYLLRALPDIGISLLKILLSDRKKRKIIKGGKHHEPATSRK